MAVREVTEETGCSACVYIGYRWVSVFICLELFSRLLMNADFFVDNVYLAALMPLCFQMFTVCDKTSIVISVSMPLPLACAECSETNVMKRKVRRLSLCCDMK